MEVREYNSVLKKSSVNRDLNPGWISLDWSKLLKVDITDIKVNSDIRLRRLPPLKLPLPCNKVGRGTEPNLYS